MGHEAVGKVMKEPVGSRQWCEVKKAPPEKATVGGSEDGSDDWC